MIETQILYDDYRAANGIKIPYSIELHRGPETYDVTVTRAAVNGSVGERVFERRIAPEQGRRAFRTDASGTRQLVGRVAAQRDEIRHLHRFDAIALADFRWANAR